MSLLYLYNILKFKKWELLFILTSLICAKWFTMVTFRADINYYTELHKCPACYGVSACNYIHKVDVVLHDFYSAFAYIFGIKNVFVGNLNGSKVIIKKLAHSSELHEFDKMLCENIELQLCGKSSEKIDKRIDVDFYELIKKQATLDFVQDNFSRLRVCPNVRHLHNLLQHVYVNNKNLDPTILNINIWTLMILNPEPLVLQILSADNGWPVPKYLGACGRIVLEEYVGSSLTTYYHEPWLLRAKIASSLLDAAYMFTYKNNDFGFYLTDVSADNIAVDSNNNIKFVDLENIIVVDRNITPEERPIEWNQLQENTENLNCLGCLAFSSTEICNHRISDHNYYAICKILLASDINDGVLPGGLLHDIPTYILQKHSNIQYLIQQCTIPEVPYTRINAGMQLKLLLDTIIHE